MKKQNKKWMARQGDVLITRVERLPKGEKQIGRVILAHGEVSVHCHEVDLDCAESWKSDDGLDVLVKTEVPVTHQEHGVIPLKVGTHEIRRQSEWNEIEIRQVTD